MSDSRQHRRSDWKKTAWNEQVFVNFNTCVNFELCPAAGDQSHFISIMLNNVCIALIQTLELPIRWPRLPTSGNLLASKCLKMVVNCQECMIANGRIHVPIVDAGIPSQNPAFLIQAYVTISTYYFEVSKDKVTFGNWLHHLVLTVACRTLFNICHFMCISFVSYVQDLSHRQRHTKLPMILACSTRIIHYAPAPRQQISKYSTLGF